MENRLKRNPKEGYLGGICHGLGIHTNLDPILWRALFFLCLGPIVYIIMWAIIKKECDKC